MIPELLEQAIITVLANDGLPFFVAATLGTTVRGAYDPLLPILKMRKEYGFWLHGDGAWGGAAMMSDRLREQFMPGLHEIDSFTCDFHKMLGSSLMCNVLLINNSNQTFGTALTAGDGTYLFRGSDDNDVDNLGSVSLQCGRRVDSLKWFLDWKYYGKAGFGRRIENYLELCKYAEQRIDEIPELEMVTPRTSFNICFQYVVPQNLASDFNEKLRTCLYHRGITLIGLADVGSRRTLRLLIANTNVDKSSIDRFFEELVSTGRELALEEISHATC